MRLSTKVAYNTLVQIASKVAITALGLVAVAILTRYLGQAGYGKYTTIMAFLSFFGIAADLGLTLVTAQMISQPGVDQNKLLNNLFSLRFFSAVFFLVLAPIVVIFLPYSVEVKIGVAITTLSFLFVSLNQIFVGLFQNKLRMDKVSIAEVVGRSALVIGVFIVSFMNWGLWGAMVATVIANGFSFFFHYYFARKFFKIRFEVDRGIWKTIFRKSWPLALTIVFNLIYLKADILVLSLVKPQSHVGIYGATYKVIDVVTIIPFMFGGIILPILTSNWVQNNLDHFKKVMQRAFDLMSMLAVPLIVGSQFVAVPLMSLIAGNNFAASGQVLKILILACAFIFIGVMFSHGIVAIDKQKKIIWAYVFTSVTSVIGYILFIPDYSYIGAAWMTVYSEALIGMFAFYYVWKYTSFMPRIRTFLKSLVAAGVMGAVLYFLPVSFYQEWPGLVGTLAISGAVYFLCLYLVKGITSREIEIILNK